MNWKIKYKFQNFLQLPPLQLIDDAINRGSYCKLSGYRDAFHDREKQLTLKKENPLMDSKLI